MRHVCLISGKDSLACAIVQRRLEAGFFVESEEDMTSQEVDSCTVKVCVAGDYDEARKILRDEAYEVGMCVTISHTKFLYTGGEEDGVEVGFVNYPRFPSSEVLILARACHVAQLLLKGLRQRTALVISPSKTIWYKEDPPGHQS